MRMRGPEIKHKVSGEKKRKLPVKEEQVFGKWLRKLIKGWMIDDAELS
jgi:hypothetical protein